MSGTKRTSRLGTMMALAAGLACAAGAQAPQTNEPQGTAAEMKPAAWQATEPTVKDDLFAGTEKFAKNASDVTEVTMDPDTLDMVNGSGAKRAHNMVLNVVRTYSYDKPGMYRMEDVDEFRRKLNTGDWHCSVHTRDLKSGESTDICNRRRTDGLVESAIVTVEPKELTFIHTIRKKGASESSVDPERVLEMGLPGGLPPAAMIAMMRPEIMNAQVQAQMQAQMAVAMAERHADNAERNASRLLAVPTPNQELQHERMEQHQEQMEQREERMQQQHEQREEQIEQRHELMQQRQEQMEEQHEQQHEQMEEQQEHLHELQTPQP